MDNLMKHWGNMSLNDREGGDFQMNKDRSSSEFAIVAKFLIRRALNTEAIVRMFNPI